MSEDALREVRRWHDTARRIAEEVRGSGADRLKLTGVRSQAILALIQKKDEDDIAFSHDCDWVPAWRGILASDYWAGKSTHRLYESLLRKEGANLERYRDDHLDSQRPNGPSAAPHHIASADYEAAARAATELATQRLREADNS